MWFCCIFDKSFFVGTNSILDLEPKSLWVEIFQSRLPSSSAAACRTAFCWSDGLIRLHNQVVQRFFGDGACDHFEVIVLFIHLGKHHISLLTPSSLGKPPFQGKCCSMAVASFWRSDTGHLRISTLSTWALWVGSSAPGFHDRNPNASKRWGLHEHTVSYMISTQSVFPQKDVRHWSLRTGCLELAQNLCWHNFFFNSYLYLV